MSLVNSIQRGLAGDKDMVYERQGCGQMFDSGEQSCPVCGSDEIAEYDLS